MRDIDLQTPQTKLPEVDREWMVKVNCNPQCGTSGWSVQGWAEGHTRRTERKLCMGKHLLLTKPCRVLASKEPSGA